MNVFALLCACMVVICGCMACYGVYMRRYGGSYADIWRCMAWAMRSRLGVVCAGVACGSVTVWRDMAFYGVRCGVYMRLYGVCMRSGCACGWRIRGAGVRCGVLVACGMADRWRWCMVCGVVALGVIRVCTCYDVASVWSGRADQTRYHDGMQRYPLRIHDRMYNVFSRYSFES